VVLFSLVFAGTGCSKSLDDDDFEKISMEYVKAAAELAKKGEATEAKLEETLKTICEEKGFSLEKYKKKVEKIGKTMKLMSDEDFKTIEKLYVDATAEIKEKVKHLETTKEKNEKEIHKEVEARKAVRLKEICIANGYKLIDYKMKNEELFRRIRDEFAGLEKEAGEGTLDASEKDQKMEEICKTYGFSLEKYNKMLDQQKEFDKIVGTGSQAQ
jgi:Skp family chaperone for outer membrane proteins